MSANSLTHPWPRLRAVACLMLIGAAALGCARLRRAPADAAPPDYLQVTGIGQPPPPEPTGQFIPETFNGVLAATAQAPVDGAVADPAQRLLLARAEARRAVLRELGRALAATTDTQGIRLGDQLTGNESQRRALATMLESQGTVTYTEDERQVQARATLAGQKVAALLKIGAVTTTATQENEGWRRQQARQNAMADATGKLRAAINALPLHDGRTVGEALDEDGAARREIDAMIFLAQPDEENYTPKGACEVKLYFDKNRVLDLTDHPRRQWWAPWR